MSTATSGKKLVSELARWGCLQEYGKDLVWRWYVTPHKTEFFLTSLHSLFYWMTARPRKVWERSKSVCGDLKAAVWDGIKGLVKWNWGEGRDSSPLPKELELADGGGLGTSWECQIIDFRSKPCNGDQLATEEWADRRTSGREQFNAIWQWRTSTKRTLNPETKTEAHGEDSLLTYAPSDARGGLSKLYIYENKFLCQRKKLFISKN